MGKEVKYILDLTHTISERIRLYKDNTIDLSYSKKAEKDKIVRETNIEFNSHVGTHIDYPAHCMENGKYGNEYSLHYLFSKKVFLIDVDLKNEQFPRITKHFVSNISIPKNIEILIIKTYFSDIRNSDKYIWSSPIIDSEIPLYLKEQFPLLKAVCLDVISVTSQLDREEGKKCHINFLSQECGREILIIEDANLNNLQKNDIIKRIFVLPLKFENMDGSPCSIIAEIERKG